MNLFESINESTKKAAQSGENYLKNSEEYFKLKIFQQLSLSYSLLIKLSIIGGLIFLGVVFLAVAGTISLGEWLGSIVFGVILVGVILLLLAMIAYLFRKKIDKIIIKKMSKSYFD